MKWLKRFLCVRSFRCDRVVRLAVTNAAAQNDQRKARRSAQAKKGELKLADDNMSRCGLAAKGDAVGWIAAAKPLVVGLCRTADH